MHVPLSIRHRSESDCIALLIWLIDPRNMINKCPLSMTDDEAKSFFKVIDQFNHSGQGIAHLIALSLALKGLDIPTPILEQAQETVFQNKIKRYWWSVVTQKADAIGLQMLTIKGPETYRSFPRPFEWRFRDLDFLIRLDEIDKCDEMLDSLGFKKGRLDGKGNITEFTNSQREYRRSSSVHEDNNVRFMHNKIPVILEPHFRLLPIHTPFQISPDLAFDTSVVRCLHGKMFSTLIEPLHFVFLCAHLYRHDTELNSIRAGNFCRLDRLHALACYAHFNSDKLRGVILEEFVSITNSYRQVNYCLAILEEVFPGLADNLGFAIDQELAIDDFSIVRYSDINGDYSPIGRLAGSPIERMFHVNRLALAASIDKQMSPFITPHVDGEIARLFRPPLSRDGI